MSKASANFSSEENRQRLRINGVAFRLAPPYGGLIVFIVIDFCRSVKRYLLERNLSSYPDRTGGRTFGLADENVFGASQITKKR